MPFWPNHEIIREIINNHILGLDLIEYRKTFISVLSAIKLIESQPNQSQMEIQSLRLLCHQMLTKLPEDLKKQIFTISFFTNLDDSCDVKCLKLIMGSTNQLKRRKIIKALESSIKELIKKGKIGMVNEFMKEILVSDNEKQSIQNSIFIGIDYLLKNAKFEAVNKLLNNLAISAENMKLLKSKIDYFAILQNFIRTHRYDRVEKFLKVMFTCEEERQYNY